MRGSIQQRGDKWRLVVEATADPSTGRRRQVTRTVAGGRRDAEDALTKLLSEVGAGHHGGHDSTLDELLDAWLDVAKLAGSTRRDYGYARRRIPARLRATRIHRIGPRDLDALYASLAAGGLGPDRIRRVHGMIRRAYAHAVRWGWVARNPATDASPPSPPSSKPKPPNVDEVRQLIAAADGEIVTWLGLEASLGARLGEMCALRWGDVDLVAGTVTVQRSLAIVTGGTAIKGTKTDRVRTVAVDAFTISSLREHRRGAAEAALASGASLGPDAYVFGRDAASTTPWRPDSFSRRIRRLRVDVGLEHVQLRALRHFVATQLLAAGVDPRTVAGRLGHARTSTTLDIYAAFVPARDRAAAELLAELLS
jgi:integrase